MLRQTVLNQSKPMTYKRVKCNLSRFCDFTNQSQQSDCTVPTTCVQRNNQTMACRRFILRFSSFRHSWYLGFQGSVVSLAFVGPRSQLFVPFALSCFPQKHLCCLDFDFLTKYLRERKWQRSTGKNCFWNDTTAHANTFDLAHNALPGRLWQGTDGLR